MELTPREKDKLLIFTAGLLAERRKAEKWKDPLEIESTPVFCGDPGFLALTLDGRATYMSTLVLVGFEADAFEGLAIGCDLSRMGSPARMWLDRGKDAAIDCLRALRPIGRRVTGSARGNNILRCYPLTPTGAAQRFREAYGYGVRYVSNRKDWRVWQRLGEQGGVWVEDERKEVEGMAEALVTHKIAVEEVKRATDPEIAGKIAAWARSLDSRRARLAILADQHRQRRAQLWIIGRGQIHARSSNWAPGSQMSPPRPASAHRQPSGCSGSSGRGPKASRNAASRYLCSGAGRRRVCSFGARRAAASTAGATEPSSSPGDRDLP